MSDPQTEDRERESMFDAMRATIRRMTTERAVLLNELADAQRELRKKAKPAPKKRAR
jgi:hypothetical protein